MSAIVVEQKVTPRAPGRAWDSGGAVEQNTLIPSVSGTSWSGWHRVRRRRRLPLLLHLTHCSSELYTSTSIEIEEHWASPKYSAQCLTLKLVLDGPRQSSQSNTRHQLRFRSPYGYLPIAGQVKLGLSGFSSGPSSHLMPCAKS